MIVLPGLPTTADAGPVITQMLRRASSPGFGPWWRRAESVGFCAHPIQLSGADTVGRRHTVWTRCNNRRASVCPSCSDLYARDTWQLVHAGAAGGHHDVPVEVGNRPQVFATLTAPSYGAVHKATGTPCHPRHGASSASRCVHGNQLRCNIIHSIDDPTVGQPLCRDCYDYLGHVLFTWHLPELWRRFTIALRRAVATHLEVVGVKPGSVRVSFVKVVELQARAIPHIHALIRLDPPADNDTTGSGDDNRYGPAAPRGGGESRPVADQHTGWSSPITAAELAALIQHAAGRVSIDVPARVDDYPNQGGVRTVRFGTQIDTQALELETITATSDSVITGTAPIASSRLSPRRVAAYLAKYVTKSLQDFGITARRLSAEAISELAVSEHVRAILSTIAELAEHTASAGPSLAGIGRWLHTLGYRGHITTKSRHYSTTMGALRAARATWTRNQIAKHSGRQNDTQSAHFADDVTASTGRRQQPIDTDEMLWEFDRAGHTSAGDRVLVISAALRHIGARITGITESRTVSTRIPPPPRGTG
ncbi:plasmid replication initiator protein [Mycobacterium gordonae]|uniref:Plasmid replication initiator protein n=1 Tax=Mycobacterium gordonae TaxID=1778 RepID=A0A0Q2QIN8_MYCGO|nr:MULTISPECIES: replication initiator [Mycobacterium]KQH79733.1 plasmid replication initiator protein [Mycobacterium gordonae]MCV7006413.1 plasmid replication initiator protein [Mycobacterium gordonae]ORV81282.1 plasmid replication initiator protein [Mycobacterium gordonae]PJE24228.1 MAG: plasmid replication initiator protein [Mycobacterium sp.]